MNDKLRLRMKETNTNYEMAFNSFAKIIKEMKTGNISRTGIKKIAKPVLLLSVIKGIETGIFKNNYIEYDKVAIIYELVFKQYEMLAKQSEHTPPYYPFYYLKTDKIWHLNPRTPNSVLKSNSPSAAWVHNNVEYAYLDPTLWEMLQQKEYRHRFAEFIIEEKIKTATANSRSMLRMFLGWLVAI